MLSSVSDDVINNVLVQVWRAGLHVLVMPLLGGGGGGGSPGRQQPWKETH